MVEKQNKKRKRDNYPHMYGAYKYINLHKTWSSLEKKQFQPQIVMVK